MLLPVNLENLIHRALGKAYMWFFYQYWEILSHGLITAPVLPTNHKSKSEKFKLFPSN